MKANISRMWRSGLALMLVLCMVVALFPAAAFATEEKTVDLDEIVDLLDAYGPELLQYGYNYASSNGDIALLNSLVNEMKQVAMEQYDAYQKSDLPGAEAIVAGIKAKLVVMEDALKATLGALKLSYDALKHLNAGTVEVANQAIEEVEGMIAEVEDALAAVREAIPVVEVEGAKLVKKLEAAGIEMDSLKGAIISLNDAVNKLFEIANGNTEMSPEEADKIYSKAREEAKAASDDVLLLAQTFAGIAGEAADIAEAVYEATAKAAKYVEGKLPLIEAAYGILPQYLTDAVEAAVARLKAEAVEAAEQVKAENADKIAAAKAELAALKAKLEETAEEYKPEVKAQIAALEAKIEGLSGAEILLGAAVKADDLRDQYTVWDVKDALAEAAPIIKENAGPAVDSAKVLMDAVVGLSKSSAKVLMVKAENAIEALKKAYYNATHDEYVITDDSKYVAIGDSTVVGEYTYVDALAGKLENVAKAVLPLYTMDYENLGAEQMLIENTAVLVENKAEIEAADLVTIGFGGADMISNAMMAMGTTPELPWADYVTEAGVVYVEKVLGTLEARLNKTRLNETQVNDIMAAVETMMFSSVSYAYLIPEMVDEIHAINPDAVVVIVGMYNPLAENTFNFGGVKIDLGIILDCLVKMVSVHDLLYCMITEKAIFVNAPAVDTDMAAGELNADNVMNELVVNMAAMNPTEAGHNYIADRIWNALTVTVDINKWLLGDVNHDGVVDSYDAALMLQYDVLLIDENTEGFYLTEGDTSGDGVVDSYDAALVLQYDVLLIESVYDFPGAELYYNS